MFEGKSLIEIIRLGGWTFSVLIIISIVSVTVIAYKLFEFWVKSKITRQRFISTLMDRLRKNRIDAAIEICENINTPMAPVAKAGLISYRDGEGTMRESMDMEIMIQTVKLEKFTTIIGTVGSVAVYIGLFGTVLGIIRAFHDIAKVGAGGISIVIGGVSEALIATAAGLFVAIPAVVAYNFLMKYVEKFAVDMEYTASTVIDFLSVKDNIPDKGNTNETQQI
ncbi:MAG: MotA/TolQ/ExbB proton channel family protein [Endomicrobia bacterium]|nr:MotA/TolQ/ExbB proton channel family protein [Endomicrobiia bacterium]MCL2506502.1 MotA/TolQ/ExbB proton channel family protein [Endomicrobiia bacterium]